MAALVSVLRSISDTFWHEDFWLPENVSWKDLDNIGDIYHPVVLDLHYAIYCAIFLFCVRKIYERYVATPLGRYLGIPHHTPRKPQTNPYLENIYHKNKFPNSNQIVDISKQTDLPQRKVERWFRMRRNLDRPSLMKRFTEAAWRFFYYFSIFIYGVVVLWDKPWFSDSLMCWVGYPHHHVPREIFWYYMIEIGFYTSLMFSQFFDVKRKDFWEMFAHHVASLLLLWFSWSGNFVRVGTLVLVIHDAADYWMEAAKMAKYLKAQKLCDILFAIFGVVWFVTRLVIFPVRIIHSTLFKAHTIVGFGPVYYMYNFLLLSLQVLHIVWTILLVRVVKAVFFVKQNTDASSPTTPVGAQVYNMSLVYLYLWVIYSTSFEIFSLTGFFPSMVFFNIMLSMLLVLHTYWFSLIVKVTITVLTTKGEEVTDIRSSSEENVSEEENGACNHNKTDLYTNGVNGKSNNHH